MSDDKIKELIRAVDPEDHRDLPKEVLNWSASVEVQTIFAMVEEICDDLFIGHTTACKRKLKFLQFCEDMGLENAKKALAAASYIGVEN